MSERGSVSIVVVAGMATMLLFALGVRDLAVVVRAVASAQTAADAAALAAVQEMAMPPTTSPVEVAGRYAALNGATVIECRCDPASFEADVRVGAPVPPLWLFPDGLTVAASARAVVDLPS